MERVPTAKQEADAIMEKTGRYVPPYRLAILLRTASKVMETITKAEIAISYAECRLLLDILDREISTVVGPRDGGEKDV